MSRNHVPCRVCGAAHKNPASSSLCRVCGKIESQQSKAETERKISPTEAIEIIVECLLNTNMLENDKHMLRCMLKNLDHSL